MAFEGPRSFNSLTTRCPAKTSVELSAAGGAGLGLFPDVPGVGNRERVLKTGLRIILEQNYTTFEQLLVQSKLKKTLQETHTQIVRKFVRKTSNNRQFNKWFSRKDNTNIVTRSNNRALLKPVIAKHEFYRKSYFPTLTELANQILHI